jgi:predicted CXXCH cytochrome family protein
MAKNRVRVQSIAVACGLAAVLCFSSAAEAQKSAAVHATAKPMVPDNPSPHPAPDQPIPYSHKLHLARGLDCKECHTNAEAGKLMTIPQTGVCMQCHVTIGNDKPAIQKLAEFSSSKQTIPWVRVYTVLPGVEWSHRPHLAAGVKCETCHGPVRDMEKMSEVTSVTTMYACLHCHELNHAKTACETCHKR